MSVKLCPDCLREMLAVEYFDGPDRYDGISEYVCVCGVRIGRWTEKRLADGELEPRYGIAREGNQ